jgi:HlyD family secretion protein
MKRVLVLILVLVPVLASCSREQAKPPPAVGTLERDRIELSAEAFEAIVEIAVREGDRVEAGTLILRLDPSRIAAQIVQARANLASTDANLRLALRGPRSERILEARARLAGAEGALATARSQVERFRLLVEDRVEAQSRLDEAQGRYEEAVGRRDETHSSLEALLEGTTVEELDLARGGFAAAEAALALLDLDRSRLEIRAPVAGRIETLPYEIGERPVIGSPVAILLAGGAPYARVHVPASVRTGLVVGETAMVRVDGQPAPLEGRLRWISHEAAFTPYYALTQHDRSRLSYLAEVDLQGEESEALPTGVPVEVTFPSTGGGEPE